MRKRRPRRSDGQLPRPITAMGRRAAPSLFFYPGAYSWPQKKYGPSGLISGGPHLLFKFCMVLFCGLSLLSGCTGGAYRQRPDDAALRYLADTEEMMPIPYTPRDDGQPLSAAELHAFKTVSDLDRHLTEEEARIVELHFKHYLHQMRGSFDVYLRRSARFMPYVKQVFASRGIPDDIAYLFMVESGGNPVAQSHAGAMGLWQFMPGTGKVYGLQQDNWLDERRDPYKATVAAANYLKRLHREFCNWHLAVAAYNAGEGKIGRAVSGTGASTFFDLCRLDAQLEARARLRDETRDYVPRLIAVAKIMRNLDRLGLAKPSDEMAWNLVPMNVPPLTDLIALSRQVGLDWESFSAMNPAYLRAASPPQQSIAYVPPEKISEAVRWAALPEARIYAGWKEHTVRKGDSLTALAKRNKVSVEAIRKANLITGLPRRGKVLLIPGDKPAQPLVASSPTVQPDAAALAALSGRAYPLSSSGSTSIAASGSFFTTPLEKHIMNGNTAFFRDSSASRALDESASNHSAGATALAESATLRAGKPSDRQAKDPAITALETQSRSAAPLKQAAASQVRSTQGTRYYKVQPGDTMFGLARKWGTDVASIQAANKMDKKKSTVRVGQRLIIPSEDPVAPAPSQPVASSRIEKARQAQQKQLQPQRVAALEAKKGTTPAVTASQRQRAGAKAFNPLTGQSEDSANPAFADASGGQARYAAYDGRPDDIYFSEQELILGSYVSPPTQGPAPLRSSPAEKRASRRDQAPMGYAISMEALSPPDVQDDDAPQVFLHVYVKQGESLEDIAQANGVPARVLRRANQLGVHEKVKTGQRILVPQS